MKMPTAIDTISALLYFAGSAFTSSSASSLTPLSRPFRSSSSNVFFSLCCNLDSFRCSISSTSSFCIFSMIHVHGKHYLLGRAKFWNIVIFSHIFVSWGSTKRKSVVTSPIVQSWAPGTHLNIMLFCPVIGCLGCSALWLVHMVHLEIFPGAQLCTMWDVSTLFLFVEPQWTKIWLNITMFQNFAHPN